MIFSLQQLLSNNQAITATAASTNVIDTLATGTPAYAQGPVEKDLGKGNPVPINIRVTEAFDALTSLKVDLEVDDNSSFSSATVVITETVLLADLVVGKDILFQYLPKGTDERYMRLNYTVTGSAPTVGTIHAGITYGNDQSWGV